MGMTTEEWLAAGILLASMAIVVLALTFFFARGLRPRSSPPAAWQSVLTGAVTAGVLFVFGYVLCEMQRAAGHPASTPGHRAELRTPRS